MGVVDLTETTVCVRVRPTRIWWAAPSHTRSSSGTQRGLLRRAHAYQLLFAVQPPTIVDWSEPQARDGPGDHNMLVHIVPSRGKSPA